MNPAQKEKLTKLITTAPMLSLGESSEWLALLDLMDDKQIGELEKILSAGGPMPKASSSSSLGAAETQAKEDSQYSQPLKHIMNLPRIADPVLGSSLPAQKTPAAVASAPVNFSDKLKNTIHEKELPGSDFTHPLEITDGVAKAPIIRPSGSSFVQFPEKIKTPAVSLVKESLIKPSIPKPAFAPTSAPKMAAAVHTDSLENLEDLATFNTQTLQTDNFDKLVIKIKSIIAKSGYHKALFSIEKSKMYEAYIKTGAEILNKQTNFEELNTASADKGFLSRAQFEKFADMLRQIQAG